MGNNGDGHSQEQGLRVHHLANLGGLIAIAGMDLEPPDFLLGALLSLAHEAASLRTEERGQMAQLGKTNSASAQRESARGNHGTALASFRP
jgi:hypothetical protein